MEAPVLPKSWGEITIRQFVEIDGWIKSTNLDPLTKELHILACLTGQPVEYFDAFTLTDVYRMMGEVSFLYSIETIDKRIPVFVELQGREYDFKPDVRAITAGQFIDLSSFVKDSEKIY